MSQLMILLCYFTYKLIIGWIVVFRLFSIVGLEITHTRLMIVILLVKSLVWCFGTWPQKDFDWSFFLSFFTTFGCYVALTSTIAGFFCLSSLILSLSVSYVDWRLKCFISVLLWLSSLHKNWITFIAFSYSLIAIYFLFFISNTCSCVFGLPYAWHSPEIWV